MRFIVVATFDTRALIERVIEAVIALGVSRDDIVISQTCLSYKPLWSASPWSRGTHREEYAAHGEHLGAMEGTEPEPESVNTAQYDDAVGLVDRREDGVMVTRIAVSVQTEALARKVESELSGFEPATIAMRWG